MAISRLESVEFTINSVGAVNQTAKGNSYLECRSDTGKKVVFWGKSGNMRNITAVQSESAPFKLQCGCIPAKWPQHDVWVPEHSRLTFMPQSAEALVSADELARYRRTLIRLLDQIEGKADTHSGLVSRIRRSAANGLIPREIAAMMLVIAEMRNVVEHEFKTLSSSESATVRNAWKALSEWAESKKLRLGN